MPALPMIALRYMLWLVGLRIVYALLVQFTGLPNAPATGVILAAAPATDIGLYAARKATRPLRLADWATIWGLIAAIFVAFNIILPAIILAPFRAALADPVALVDIVTIAAATVLLMALFLWIGKRAGGDPRR